MNYKIVIILFISLKSALTVQSQKVDSSKIKLIEDVMTNEYKIYYSKEKVDKRFLKYLKKKRHVDMEMVNPGELYNETDVVMDNFPMLRLILFGKGGNGTNLILYESGGGNASFTYALIYKRYNRFYNTVLIRTKKLYTIDKFKEAIKNKQYEIW